VLPDDEPPPTPAPAETALATASPEDVTPPAAAPAKAHTAESAELTLFRRAQALHLSKDPKAIEAWDAYLRVAGTSALAPEARYNRALGLVRAQRFTEAKAALAPFAEGKYGSYRREEAQALLARLPK
jgi:TolA-binding protein